MRKRTHTRTNNTKMIHIRPTHSCALSLGLCIHILHLFDPCLYAVVSLKCFVLLALCLLLQTTSIVTNFSTNNNNKKRIRNKHAQHKLCDDTFDRSYLT